MGGQKRLVGIYMICCLPTGEVYVGGSSKIFSRLHYHHMSLKRGLHANIGLRKAYKKFGAKVFTFCILELGEEEDLQRLEQKWIEFFPRELLFNRQSAIRSNKFRTWKIKVSSG